MFSVQPPRQPLYQNLFFNDMNYEDNKNTELHEKETEEFNRFYERAIGFMNVPTTPDLRSFELFSYFSYLETPSG